MDGESPASLLKAAAQTPEPFRQPQGTKTVAGDADAASLEPPASPQSGNAAPASSPKAPDFREAKEGHIDATATAVASASAAAAAREQLLQLVEHGLECTLCQLLETGLMHADPHPGNVLMLPDGRLCYLDFGLLVEVPPKASQASGQENGSH